jgi:hypothetical protein
MSGQTRLVVQLLEDMAACELSILELDLEREGQAEELRQLQDTQVELRNKLEAASLREWSQDPSVRAKLSHCIELEQDVNRKLSIYRNYVSGQLNRLQEGSKSRNLYNQEYSQAEGYFIDSKK